MDLIDELIETLADPRALHAATVHLPVTTALLGPALVLAWARARRGRRALGRIAAVTYALLGASAAAALQSGTASRGLLGRVDPALLERVALHERLAEVVPWLALLPLAGLWWAGPGRRRAWPAMRHAPDVRRRRRVGTALALAGALLGAGWVGLTGHHGGLLVYDDRVGLLAQARRDNRSARGDTAARASSPSLATAAASPSADPGGGLAAGAGGPLPGPGAPGLDDLARQARELLDARCLGCHGAGPEPGGGLLTTDRAALLRGGGRGPALVPGDSAASLLHQVVSGRHASLVMPWRAASLSDAQQGLLAEWIDAGAVWPDAP